MIFASGGVSADFALESFTSDQVMMHMSGRDVSDCRT